MSETYEQGMEAAAAILEKRILQTLIVRCTDVPLLVVSATGGDEAAARKVALVDVCMQDAMKRSAANHCLMCDDPVEPSATGALVMLSENFEADGAQAVFYLMCRSCESARPDNAVLHADFRARFGGTLIQHEAGHA
jgi:hypothetical protein